MSWSNGAREAAKLFVDVQIMRKLLLRSLISQACEKGDDGPEWLGRIEQDYLREAKNASPEGLPIDLDHDAVTYALHDLEAVFGAVRQELGWNRGGARSFMRDRFRKKAGPD